MKRESYNPFLMFGSYIGAIAGGVINGYDLFTIQFQINGQFVYPSVNEVLFLYGGFSTIFFGALFGFLFGWSIHSLIRRLSK